MLVLGPHDPSWLPPWGYFSFYDWPGGHRSNLSGRSESVFVFVYTLEPVFVSVYVDIIFIFTSHHATIPTVTFGCLFL